MLAWHVAFARWDPLQDLLTLHERLTRLTGEHSHGWVPPADLYETAAHYLISVELPGLTRDDFDIAVTDGKVVLKGQRTKQAASAEQFHRVERGRGHFLRTFSLAQPIDDTRISADLRDGVLSIVIPKVAVRPRHVEVL